MVTLQLVSTTVYFLAYTYELYTKSFEQNQCHASCDTWNCSGNAVMDIQIVFSITVLSCVA